MSTAESARKKHSENETMNTKNGSNRAPETACQKVSKGMRQKMTPKITMVSATGMRRAQTLCSLGGAVAS